MSLGSVLQFALLLSAIGGGFAYSLKDEIKEHGLVPKVQTEQIKQEAKEYSGYNNYEKLTNTLDQQPVFDSKISYISSEQPAK